MTTKQTAKFDRANEQGDLPAAVALARTQATHQLLEGGFEDDGRVPRGAMGGLTLKERVTRACALLTLIHAALGEDDLLKVLNQDAVQAGLLIASREAGELLAPLRSFRTISRTGGR